MLNNLLNIDVLIVIFYLMATIFVGLKSSRKIRNIRDYAVADKNYSTLVVISTIFATFTGGFAVMGIIEKIHSAGIIFGTIFFGQVVQKLLIAYYIAPNINKFKDAISSGDLMHRAYGDEGKIITGLMAFLVLIGFTGVQITAIGQIFEYFLKIDFTLGVILGAGIVVIYSTLGGIKSVTATDLLQFCILIVAIPLVLSISLWDNIGGYEQLFAQLPKSHHVFDISTKDLFYYVIPLFLLFSIPFEAPMAQRILIQKNELQIKNSMKIAAFIEIPFIITVVLIALVAIVLYPDIESKFVLPHMLNEIIPTGFKGFAIAGLLAVVMSTADSNLNTASLSITHDFYSTLFKKHKINQLFVARFVTLFMGICGMFLAISYKSILDIAVNISGIWSSTILFPLFMTMIGKNIPKKYFIITVIIGTITYFAWPFIYPNSNLSGLMVGLIVNVILFMFFYLSCGYNDNHKINKRKNNPIIPYVKHLINIVLHPIKSIRYIIEKSSQNISSYEAHYIAYGAYMIISLFIVVGRIDPDDIELFSIFRTIMGILAFALIIQECWSDKFKKYLPLFWFLCLCYGLPFTSTIYLMSSDFNQLWLIDTAIAVFLLAIFTDLKSFFAILFLGATAGILFFFLFLDTQSVVTSHNISWEVAIKYVILLIIVQILYRYKEITRDDNLKKIAAKLGLNKVALQEALEIRKNIFKNFTHEFNTPQQAMMSLIEFAKNYKSYPPEALIEIAKGAEKNMEILKRYTENITKIINSKSEKLASIDNYEINNILNIVMNITKNFSNEFNISINSAESYLNIICDKEQIENLINNIIDNTIRYMPKGQKDKNIIINIFKQNTNILLQIIDNGPGISEKEIVKIFEPLTQGSSSKSNVHRKGMGLTICHDIVSNHGGNIWIENNKNAKGLTVNIILPYSPFVKTENLKIVSLFAFIDKAHTIIYKIDQSTLVIEQIAVVETSSGIKSLDLLKEYINDLDHIYIKNPDNTAFLEKLYNECLNNSLFSNVKITLS